MELPEKLTIGDKYDPAMKIEDQAEADEYFEACVQHQMRFGFLPSTLPLPSCHQRGQQFHNSGGRRRAKPEGFIPRSAWGGKNRNAARRSGGHAARARLSPGGGHVLSFFGSHFS